MEKQYDYLAKLLIIGDTGVGKTNILLRFCENTFFNSHLSTIGIDFKVKTTQVDGKKVKMQIWDTAGQQRFKTITHSYYKGAMGVILVFAIDNDRSFDSLQNWIRQILSNTEESVVKVLVGNKCDCTSEQREVTPEQAEKLAATYGIEYFQVSAKQGINVKELFYHLGKNIKIRVFDKLESMGETSAMTEKQLTIRNIAQNKSRTCC